MLDAFALQADGWWLRSDIIERVELYCPCGCGYAYSNCLTTKINKPTNVQAVEQ